MRALSWKLPDEIGGYPLPTGAQFSQQHKTLDPDIFTSTEEMRPEVRDWCLGKVNDFWQPLYGSWWLWAKVYLAGSSASYWWSGDNDLDLLIGVSSYKFAAAHPEMAELAKDQRALCARFNEEFREGFNGTVTLQLQGEDEQWHSGTLLLSKTKKLSGSTEMKSGASRISTPRWGLPQVSSMIDCVEPRLSQEASSRTEDLRGTGGLVKDAIGAVGRNWSLEMSSFAQAVGIKGHGLHNYGPDMELPSRNTGNSSNGKVGSALFVADLLRKQAVVLESIIATGLGELEDYSATTATLKSSILSNGESDLSNISQPERWWDVTLYANPFSYDIRVLKPYAAYSISDDIWAVHPAKLPKSFSAKSMPRSFWESVAKMAGHIKDVLAEGPDGAERQAELLEELHHGRQLAYSGVGSGVFDQRQVLWLALERIGILQDLIAAVHPDSVPHPKPLVP